MSEILLEARRGRTMQRYDSNNYRLVAGCIPYRLYEREIQTCNLMDRLEVLMISTPNRTDLVFPKGGWENDETIYEAACREAIEEAGVKGIINKYSLGEWIFKSKSSENSCSPRSACKGRVFALQVTEELDDWPEQSTHDRKWVAVMDAYALCRYEWMREALDSFIELFSGQKLSNPNNSTTAANTNTSTNTNTATTTTASQDLTDLRIIPPSTTEQAIALC